MIIMILNVCLAEESAFQNPVKSFAKAHGCQGEAMQRVSTFMLKFRFIHYLSGCIVSNNTLNHRDCFLVFFVSPPVLFCFFSLNEAKKVKSLRITDYVRALRRLQPPDFNRFLIIYS